TGMQKRMPMSVMRYAALLVALVGMVCLHLMAMYRDVPATTIGAITPNMNYAYKSVTGRATQAPRFYEENGKLTGVQLTIADDSGELRVRGFKPVAEALRQRGVQIRKGDKVKVAGTLRVIEDNVSMMLQVPEHLEILDTVAPTAVAFNELGGVEDGKLVTVRGIIERVDLPRSERAPYNILMSDGTGTGRVVAWRNVFDASGNDARLQRGATVEVRANVAQFRGEPQLQLADARDITVVADASQTDAGGNETATPVVALSELGSDHVGKNVQIKGIVRSVRAPGEGSRAPYMVTLDDNGTEMTLVFWSATYAQLANAAALCAGAPVKATVAVSDYRGKLQLTLKDAANLEIGKADSPAPAAKPKAPASAKAPPTSKAPSKQSTPSMPSTSAASPVLTPSAAAALDDGAQVVVSGMVKNVRLAQTGSRAPTCIYLVGDKADVQLVCWADTYEAIPSGQRPGVNSAIKATVTVASFKGTKQLKLMKAGDFTLLARGMITTAATPAEKPTLQAGGGDMSVREALTKPANTAVRVKAQIKSVIPPPSDRTPYRIILEDGGKELTVVIWAQAFAQIPPDQRPEPGKLVCAEGLIVEFKGTKQVRVNSPNQLRLVK
ncbi:MAG: hypothetical protein NTV22_18335, partial [bacterium]|nr:hypothetical protein [bacterium]